MKKLEPNLATLEKILLLLFIVLVLELAICVGFWVYLDDKEFNENVRKSQIEYENMPQRDNLPKSNFFDDFLIPSSEIMHADAKKFKKP